MPLMSGTSSQLGSATLGDTGATALTGVGTFTDLCDIYANQGGEDGLGGFFDDWRVTASGVPCAIKMLAPRTERAEADEVRAFGVYDISLPTDTEIDPSDRIVCNGVTYEVQQRGSRISNQTAIIVRAVLVN